jgi:hypothetical protein
MEVIQANSNKEYKFQEEEGDLHLPRPIGRKVRNLSGLIGRRDRNLSKSIERRFRIFSANRKKG